MKLIRNRFGAFLVVAGAMQSVALAGDAGLIKGWGYGSNLSSLGPCIQIATAIGHNAVIKEDGTVVMMGSNSNGQCTLPANLGPCKKVAVGGTYEQGFTVALKTEGTVAAWGYNTNGQCSVPSDLGFCKQVSVGEMHAIALKNNGTIVGWGNNSYSQCSPPGSDQIIEITSGNFHNLAIQENGSVLFWGRNFYGAGDLPANLGPCKGIAAGAFFSAAIQLDGTVVVWGYNAQNQLNIPTNLGPCKKIAASDYNIAVIKENGIVVVWGYDGTDMCKVPIDLGPCTEVSLSYYSVYAIQVPPSSITGVLPISGPTTGGTAITISGTKFQNPPIVKIGGVLATDVVWVSSNTVTAVTPIGTPGMTTVSVNEISVEGFYYRPTCGADLDNNNVVDSADLGYLLLEFGNCSSESATATEPVEPVHIPMIEQTPLAAKK